jgi:hypothetical protein
MTPKKRGSKVGRDILLDEYIAKVLVSIAVGINNCNAAFEEEEPVFFLPGGKDDFIEFQVLVEPVKSKETVHLRVPYLTADTQPAPFTTGGVRGNIVRFKVRSPERTTFKIRSNNNS